MKTTLLFLSFFFCTACTNSSQLGPSPKKGKIKGQVLHRQDTYQTFPKREAKTFPKRPLYPWEQIKKGSLPTITKEFFRCKGVANNPAYYHGEERIEDCRGSSRHSLPLKDEKEHVPPVFLLLLNHLQELFQKPLIITSAHRCPAHNRYVNPSSYNQSSKHMIAAEVSFYLEGMEQAPQKIVDALIHYYQNISSLSKDKDFSQFQRYEKPDTNVSTKPWYNKEIFIKLFQAHEGRDKDNRHPYPYVSIQLRYDRDTKSKVQYNWNQAYKQYYRW